jgi:PKD repeat protein
MEMMTLTFRRHVARAAAVALGLALSGCGLDKVGIPGYSGPSTLGNTILLHITPDVLLADAVSTAVVHAEVRGPNGEPLGGRTVFFAVTDENGNYVDLGTLYSNQGTFHPPAPQTTEVTASNGVAQVIYRVPERISVTAIQRVFIRARLVSDDAQGQVYRAAQVELRPAEVRRFPEDPDNSAPDCGFFIDPEVGPRSGAYPTGMVVRFRSTSSDDEGPIVRYYWDFGDGGFDDKPDTQHAWGRSGVFEVTHVVTDTNGAQSACALTVTVVP